MYKSGSNYFNFLKVSKSIVGYVERWGGDMLFLSVENCV
ncbi:hypothetical protein GGR08_001477 [Bartonella fuyuanensis]|uniref:Uncharacterized protein n=1 Tax=Bartonella fuyuanensis TaxID=1460968 RepID=A0A840DW54_9HYPH|nr:hypothetical protein [Bartonella fuyuanensis]